MPQSEIPNFEEYAANYQKMIADNLAQFDAMKEELLQQKEVIIDEQNAAKEERKRIEKDAKEIASTEFDKKFTQLKEELRAKLQFDLIKKLILANRTDTEIEEWLNINPELIRKAKFELGFNCFGNDLARVYYSGEGRGGIIHFQLGQKIIDFHWEFGGGNSLALIFIPEEVH